MPEAMPDALLDALLDALPGASTQALPDALPAVMPAAMHATQRNATNEESILRHLQTDDRNLPAEVDEIETKCADCERPAKLRGLCAGCYQRRRVAGELDGMPRKRMHRLADYRLADCPVCDEVATLGDYGFTAAEILRALGRNVEAVGRHVRHHAPHLFPIIADEVRAAIAERKANR